MNVQAKLRHVNTIIREAWRHNGKAGRTESQLSAMMVALEELAEVVATLVPKPTVRPEYLSTEEQG